MSQQQEVKIDFSKLESIFGSFGYKRFLYEWSDRVLNTLETIDALKSEEVTARLDDSIAEILFNYNVLTIGYMKDLEAYGKDEKFSKFYEEFKQTGIYQDMVKVREIKGKKE
ncbi:MAG: hypothetical protein AABW56_03905 [Nanoarchaeota archaeon]